MALLANCGVIYGGRYVWWQVARLVALLMTVLAGAMPGWSYDSVTGTRVGLYHTCMRAICTTTFDGKLERGSYFILSVHLSFVIEIRFFFKGDNPTFLNVTKFLFE